MHTFIHCEYTEITVEMDFIETLLVGFTPTKPKQNGSQVQEQTRLPPGKHKKAGLTQKSLALSQTTDGRRFTRSVIESQSLDTTTNTQHTNSPNIANSHYLVSKSPAPSHAPTDTMEEDINPENLDTSPKAYIGDELEHLEQLEQQIWEDEPENAMNGHETCTPTKTDLVSDLALQSANISSHASPRHADLPNPPQLDNRTSTTEDKHMQCFHDSIHDNANTHTLEQLTRVLQNFKKRFDEQKQELSDEVTALKTQNNSLLQLIDQKVLQATADLKSQITGVGNKTDALMTKSNSQPKSQLSPEDLENRIRTNETQIRKIAQEEARHMSTEARKFLANKLGKQIGDEIETLRKDFRNKTNIIATEADNNQKQINNLSTKLTSISDEMNNWDVKGVMDTLAETTIKDGGPSLDSLREQIQNIHKKLEPSQGYQVVPTNSPEIKLINARIEQASKALSVQKTHINVLEKKGGIT